MTSTYLSIRRGVAALACAAVALAASGCTNSAEVVPSQGSAANSSRTKPTSSSGFTFYTVDYPYESPNRITGIADNQEIVGVYGDNGSHGAYHSYTSQYASKHAYTQFQNDDYPNAPATYMTSIAVLPHSNDTIQAGYVIDPYTLQGTWGVINNKGLWTLVQNHPGEGKCHMLQLFGVNSGDYAVGFYWYDQSPPSGKCSKHAQYVTEMRPGEKWHDFAVKGAYPDATAINSSNWVAGSTDNSGKGPSQGWTKAVCKGCKGGVGAVRYWNYNNDSKRSTLIYGANDAGTVVGSYQDGSDNWHGFIVDNLFKLSGYPVWQSIDEPDGNGTQTVISGIDNSGDICGWYAGNDGVTHGFVAIYK